MVKDAIIYLLLLSGAGLGYWLLRCSDQGDQGKQSDQGNQGATNVSMISRRPVSTWQPPPAAAPYLSAFSDAERINGLPHNLLTRMAQQESNFNPAARGASGEIGIMQIIPKWHPDVDASNPYASIDYAGRWLRSLYNRFGTWEHAIAAYNWGPTALGSYGLAAAPASTKRYIAAIARDVVLT